MFDSVKLGLSFFKGKCDRVIFWIEAILKHDGERGLKGALDSLEAQKNYLMIQDEGAITDADTQEDYQHLVELYHSGLISLEDK